MGSYTKHPRGPTGAGRRAAVYMRMSTDHQRYSIEAQTQSLAAYAVAHGIQIVSAYADEGKSGVQIKGRTGLKSLLADAQAPACPFDVVLIVDVSRWGRFQNTDESAYYEFLCWQSGVALIYCAEAFANDGSSMSTIMKSMKRVMAAEYSRDLSRRIAAGKILAARRGGHAGGPAAYGLRRVLVDEHGNLRHALAQGERRAFATDTIQLAPGPDFEVNIIRRIFRYFGQENRPLRWIYDKLNAEGVPSPYGSKWCHQTLRQILSNESYLGVQIYNRSEFLMKECRIPRPPEQHVRVTGLFPPIVSPTLFARASAKNQVRRRPKTKAELIHCLQSLHAKHGRLSLKLINADRATPGHQTFITRFGSLLDAYAAAGLSSHVDHRRYFLRHDLAQAMTNVRMALMQTLTARGHRTVLDQQGVMGVDGQYGVIVHLCLCRTQPNGDPFWRFSINPQHGLVLVTCLNATSDGVAAQFLFLAEALRRGYVVLDEENDDITELHRLRTLKDFPDLAQRLLSGQVRQPTGRFGRTRETTYGRWHD